MFSKLLKKILLELHLSTRNFSDDVVRLTSKPFFSYFSLIIDQEPYFSLLLRKPPYYPYFLTCHVVKIKKEHLIYVFFH